MEEKIVFPNATDEAKFKLLGRVSNIGKENRV